MDDEMDEDMMAVLLDPPPQLSSNLCGPASIPTGRTHRAPRVREQTTPPKSAFGKTKFLLHRACVEIIKPIIKL